MEINNISLNLSGLAGANLAQNRQNPLIPKERTKEPSALPSSSDANAASVETAMKMLEEQKKKLEEQLAKIQEQIAALSGNPNEYAQNQIRELMAIASELIVQITNINTQILEMQKKLMESAQLAKAR